MPYFAPLAPMPITSWAPRLAEMNARPVIQAGIDRPDRKKSVLVFAYRFSTNPMPSTNAEVDHDDGGNRSTGAASGPPRS